MMKRILFLGVAVLAVTTFMMGCKSKTEKQKTKEKQEATQELTLQVDEVLEKADSLLGHEVNVEAVCTHICAHGGGKIFLMGSDDTKMLRVEAGEKIGSFKPECVNNLVQVKGILAEQRIDESVLVNMENEAKNQTGEKHGAAGDGCESSQKARGEQPGADLKQRIANFRKRIAERKEKEGKDYLSFYHIEGSSYKIIK